uniref:14 kDa zinc-binding protein isoform X3 n=1 Tax=Rhizophora mucronata TaxID=61149 RepID=A0A2P2LEY0_RHIMU
MKRLLPRQLQPLPILELPPCIITFYTVTKSLVWSHVLPLCQNMMLQNMLLFELLVYLVIYSSERLQQSY